MKKISFIAVVISIFFFTNVKASVLTPTQNLYEATQANYLINMAYSQVNNFTNQKFVVFQIDNDYYLVTAKEASIDNGVVVFSNSTIIHAVRNTSSGYYNYYSYLVTSESSTSVSLNYVVISNISMQNSMSSSVFDDLKYHKDMRNIFIFVLGLCFAIFLTKERRF